MLHSLLAFALAELVFSLSPGPAVFLVISKSMRHGFGMGALAGCGILAVNIFYFALSAVGVGAALAASPAIFLALKYLGAAYLAWTAFGILRDVWRVTSAEPVNQIAWDHNGAGRWVDAFLAGGVTQASSVKNLVIFLAIIPQFIDHSQDVTAQFAALCAVSVLVELPALLGYSLLAASMAQTVRGTAMRRYLDGAAAMILIAIAGSIVISPIVV